MKKKMFCVVLALVLTFNLSSIAFASEADSTSTTVITDPSEIAAVASELGCSARRNGRRTGKRAPHAPGGCHDP